MIRKHQESDVDQVVNVWYASASVAHPFLDAAFMEKERKNVRELYLPNTETWVYEQDNQVVGFIAMMGNEVGAVFVQPEHHGQGIGTRLMNVVAELHTELEVEVFERNTIGRAFYGRYGFKLIKESVHEETNQPLLRLKFSKQ